MGILDARDTRKSSFIVSLLSTRVRVCAGSSICPLLYIVGVSVLYTIGVCVCFILCDY